MAGASRSPTIVCAYLMWQWKIGATAALDIVRKVHTHTHPNPSFRAALRHFEVELQSTLESLPDTPLAAIRNTDTPPSSEAGDSDAGGALGICADDWT
jgi:hypothetical protein